LGGKVVRSSKREKGNTVISRFGLKQTAVNITWRGKTLKRLRQKKQFPPRRKNDNENDLVKKQRRDEIKQQVRSVAKKKIKTDN